jgi:hypothetical protein
MARRFLAALALARGASALLDGFVDVLVNVEHRLPADAFAGVVHAAGSSDDDGYDACVVANDVLESCYDAGYMEPTAAVDDADRCLCCAGTTPISKVYSSCASYALNEVPGATADYTGTPSPPDSLSCSRQLSSSDSSQLSQTCTSTARRWAPVPLQRVRGVPRPDRLRPSLCPQHAHP